MVMPVSNYLDMEICSDPADAIARGFDYRSQPEIYSPCELEKVVIVRNGTEEGRSSVDFIVRAPDGRKYVFMLSHRLVTQHP